MAQNELTDFLNNMKFRFKILDETRKETNFYLARDFNVFKYIAPDENLLSDIVADLINPEGTHGQGSVFICNLLRMIKPSHDPNPLCQEKIRVIREQTTDDIHNSQRRIDIAVNFGRSQFCLGIENKPFTYDQKDQIKDYAEDLGAKSKDNFFLIYLSKDGSDPVKESIDPQQLQKLRDRNSFMTWGYSAQFLDWLVECRKDCESEKIRFFLSDLIGYVERNFELTNESGQ